MFLIFPLRFLSSTITQYHQPGQYSYLHPSFDVIHSHVDLRQPANPPTHPRVSPRPPLLSGHTQFQPITKTQPTEAGLPVPPTSPPTAYIAYSRDWFTKNKASSSGPDGRIDLSIIGPQIASEWASLAAGEKSRYESAYKRARDSFAKEFTAFSNSLGKGDLHAIEKITGSKVRSPGGRKNLLAKTGGTRQLSGYQMFIKDLRSNQNSLFINDNLDQRAKIAEFGKKAGQAWRTLSESEKDVSCCRSVICGALLPFQLGQYAK